MGVIPIVNENDTLAVAEIKFGDNDTLSAITAGMIKADYLFLMTDVDCLYDKNPRTHLDAKPIAVVENIAELNADVSSAGSALGTGGMGTKIIAARLATSAGVTTVITKSSKPGNIPGIVAYLQSLSSSSTKSSPSSSQILISEASSALSLPEQVPLHTRFVPSIHPVQNRSFWLLHGIAPHGTIYIDQYAYAGILQKAGLGPGGIIGVEGNFAQQDAVRICVVELPSPTNPALDALAPPVVPSAALYAKAEEVGRAVVTYSSIEIDRIKGFRPYQISSVLGYALSEYVALKENISFFAEGNSRPPTPTFEQTSGTTVRDIPVPNRNRPRGSA